MFRIHLITILLIAAGYSSSCGRHTAEVQMEVPIVIDPPSSEIGAEAKWIENSEIVIEGTVISQNRGFYHNNIYSSCLVEVNQIFHGELEEEVIEVFVMGGRMGDQFMSMSHGQIALPPFQTTGIFRIKSARESKYREQYVEMIAATPFELYYAVKEVVRLFPEPSYAVEEMHVEREIYQALEAEFGRARKVVRRPAATHPVAIASSMNQSLGVPNRQTGLLYSVTPVVQSKQPGRIGLNVRMTGTNTVTYLHRGELIVEYNTAAFGDSIVSKERLTYVIPGNFRAPHEDRKEAYPYDVTVTVEDIDSGRFRIVWENQAGVDSCIQILPRTREMYALTLHLLPLNEEERTGLRLSVRAADNLRYDHTEKRVAPYEYVALRNLPSRLPAYLLLPAVVREIAPARVQPMDTITVRGRHLLYSQIAFYAECQEGHKRFGNVAENYVLERTDSLMRIIVPPLVTVSEESSLYQNCFTTSGKMQFTKGYDDFQVKSWSGADIRIDNPMLD